jgi:hypothetical protein
MLQLLAHSGFGIVCEKRWQGVMLTRSSALDVSRLPSDKGKPLLYIDFLEITPWNWPIVKLGRDGRSRSIGTTLFLRAVCQNDEKGFHVRIGLHALRQAAPFYEKACGMTPVSRDAHKHGLLYFELPRKDAQKLLAEGKKQ